MTRAAIASIGLAALILSACVDMARLTVADTVLDPIPVG
jgi:hypothetical protein